MKTLLLTALAPLALAAAAAPFTYETPGALTSVGDLDNDGRADAVLVDRASGVIRFALQQQDGSFLWASPEPSGIEEPSSLSVGRFGGSTLGDQIAVTAPAANRATLFALPAAGAALTARHASPGKPMPHSITALDAGGDGVDDLVFCGDSGGDPRYYERLVTGLDGVPSVEPNGREASERTHRGFPFVRKAGTAPVAVVIRGAQVGMAPAATAGFGESVVLGEVVGTSDTLMAWGLFDGSEYAHALLYVPGDTNMFAAQVEEPVWEEFQWCAVSEHFFPKPVRLLVTIPLASGARLAVLFADGTARVFDFSGAGAPVERAALAGSGFDWMLPLGNDALLTGRGSVVERWDTSPGGTPVLSPTWSGTLPAVGAASRFSNVVFVSAEPFAVPDASPVSTAHVYDWSVAAAGDSSAWWVTGLTLGVSGLGTPTDMLCLPQPGAPFALVNQYRPNVTLRLLEPSVGPPLDDLTFSPPPGTYPPLAGGVGEPGQFTVTLTPTRSGVYIFWRTAPDDPWSQGASVVLSGDATIEAYVGVWRSTKLSPVRRATYAFAPSPGLQTGESVDADADGLPDEWEKVFNAGDPLADSDSDGKSNLQEFLDKTDPRDAGSAAPSVPFLLSATNVSSEEGKVLILEWPLAHADAVLRRCENLQGGEWLPVTEGVEQTATGFRYAVPLDAPAAFFQLWKP